MSRFFDYIEIGTSDFDTLAQLPTAKSKRGISIDPFQKYLDGLPNHPDSIKICCAISDKEEEATIHYIPEDKIKENNLPSWVRGGPRLYDRNPFVLTLCKERNINPDDVYVTDLIQTKRLKTIIDEHNVGTIKILKIDTEGHDDIILHDYFTCCKNGSYPYPFVIKYEHILIPPKRRACILNTSIDHGYNILKEGLEDTILMRSKHV